MPSKLHLVVDAHTKFEISSFSRSKDIGVRILKIWASSAILDSILGEFSRFRLFHGATEYHLMKYEHNPSTCGWVRAMKPFSNYRTLGAPIGTMNLRVGALAARSLLQMRAQTSSLHRLLLDFWIFAKSQRSECECGRKTGQNFAFLTPCVK